MAVTTFTLLLALLQPSADFTANAPLGTGIEWMVLASVILPALALIVLVYLGQQQTV